jgi:hypothetical protein
MRFSRLRKSDAPTGQQPKGFQDDGLGFAIGVGVVGDAVVVLDGTGGASESTHVQYEV